MTGRIIVFHGFIWQFQSIITGTDRCLLSCLCVLVCLLSILHWSSFALFNKLSKLAYLAHNDRQSKCQVVQQPQWKCRLPLGNSWENNRAQPIVSSCFEGSKLGPLRFMLIT